SDRLKGRRMPLHLRAISPHERAQAVTRRVEERVRGGPRRGLQGGRRPTSGDAVEAGLARECIDDVGPFSFIVALLAGAAGRLSPLSAKSSALVGVFISVTAVPAASYAVVAATLNDWSRAPQSLGQSVD